MKIKIVNPLKITIVLSILSISILITAFPYLNKVKKAVFPLYIYQNIKCYNYYPTGFMGDHSDLKINRNWRKNPKNGTSSIKIGYSAKMLQKRGWAGIFWQSPAGNWGSVASLIGGYNLTGAKKLYFYARGEKGGEIVAFKLGGLIGNTYYDTGHKNIGPQILTRKWKRYALNLEDVDLRHIIGGFCIVLNPVLNPKGCTFYLDDIYFSE